MKKLLLSLTTLALLIVLATACGGSSDGGVFDDPNADPRGDTGDNGDTGDPRFEHKEYVCHNPEDGSRAHTILVAKSALDHHLGHGDTIGHCPDNPMPETGRVTICHFPRGNGHAEHTITIGGAAYDHHEGHGDTIGECPEE